MKTFLQQVAHDLYNKLGENLSHTAVVFPNRRASLFFNEYLAAESNRPIWSPAYVSISDLFRQFSTLKVGDPIRLVCELYKVFQEKTGSEEMLDEFYFWGELLISDFDDVDKNMVDARQLFNNLQALKDMTDDLSFLDEEQVEALQHFFQNFSIEKQTVLKERFVSLWDRLGDIYHAYKEALQLQGIAYEGMMYREVIEQLDTDRLPYNKYVFVGFNVLNKVETTLFQKLQKAGKAMFYWDYDTFYANPKADLPYKHEAGEFILRNLMNFPNELPADCFNKLGKPKQIRFISAPTENAQARFVTSWRQSLPVSADSTERDNAVVLCNESLLLPVLHAIPKEVKNMNITMGFPVVQTPVYSYINVLLDLQTNAYHPDNGTYDLQAILNVLSHPYIQKLVPEGDAFGKELLKKNNITPRPSDFFSHALMMDIFTPQGDNASLCKYLLQALQNLTVIYQHHETEDVFNNLYRESVFKVYTVINRLHSLIESGILQVKTNTFRRLMSRLMQSVTIPFHGEPAVGLQVMGVLETRNLDFKNLLMLSVNEGKLPKNEGDSSFIPYNLRKAFGMTTIDHKNAVYAYYFYRLIQRAETVTLTYNTSADGLNRGEMSRFMLQLLIEYPYNIRLENLSASQSPMKQRNFRIEKTPEIMQRLFQRFNAEEQDKYLSPSALNRYLNCRMSFFFHYVARLRTPDQVNADIDASLFGTLFHDTAELIYTDLMQHGKEIRKEDIEGLLKNKPKILEYVNRAFKKHISMPDDSKLNYSGTQIISLQIIASYLQSLLKHDHQYAPFQMEGLEVPVEETYSINTPAGVHRVKIGGRIDRMDNKEGTCRIIDYKTNGKDASAADITDVFTPSEKRSPYIFQTFLYASIVSRQRTEKVSPAIFYVNQAASDDYSPVIKLGELRKKTIVDDFSQLNDEFHERLMLLLQEIFNPDEPFTQTNIPGKCEYCDFKSLCRKR